MGQNCHGACKLLLLDMGVCYTISSRQMINAEESFGCRNPRLSYFVCALRRTSLIDESS